MQDARQALRVQCGLVRSVDRVGDLRVEVCENGPAAFAKQIKFSVALLL